MPDDFPKQVEDSPAETTGEYIESEVIVSSSHPVPAENEWGAEAERAEPAREGAFIGAAGDLTLPPISPPDPHRLSLSGAEPRPPLPQPKPASAAPSGPPALQTTAEVKPSTQASPVFVPQATAPASAAALPQVAGLARALAPATNAAHAAAPADLGVISRYRLLQQLAVGGMAQLFLAAIEGPDGFSKQCVVKTILPEFAGLQDFTEMFINEARVTAMLRHPNIVEIYDFGREGSRYFIAMEYVHGFSLHTLLRHSERTGRKLGPRFALTIGLQMCDALAYAHALNAPDGRPLNLVHRDLSTGNILISSAGMAKLTDFGIVKSDINMNSTAVGVVKGKYPYMSPEQIRNEPLDSRSDIFSLSTVLYEVATGVALFKRKSLADTINAVAYAEVPPPSEVVPGFPPLLEAVILKGLSLERENRFQNFGEMADALERFRSSGNWTSSSRELASIVQSIFSEGAAPGAYTSSPSGLAEAEGEAVKPPSSPSARALRPGSSGGSQVRNSPAPTSKPSTAARPQYDNSGATEASLVPAAPPPAAPAAWGPFELALVVVAVLLVIGLVLALT